MKSVTDQPLLPEEPDPDDGWDVDWNVGTSDESYSEQAERMDALFGDDDDAEDDEDDWRRDEDVTPPLPDKDATVTPAPALPDEDTTAAPPPPDWRRQPWLPF